MEADPDGNGTPVALHLRFPGQYFDVETELHYNMARYYSPDIGRYIEADPIGIEGGINVYAYAENSPINFFDPYGLRCTARQLLVLQLAVNIACKWSGERRCTANDDCPTNRNKIAKNSACIAARRAINQKCFKGGDAGHRQAEEEAKNALKRCLELRSKCCNQ